MVFELGCLVLVSILNKVDLFVLLGLIIFIIVFFGILNVKLLISMWLLYDFLRLFILIILLFKCLFGGMKSLLVLLCFW